MSKVETRKHSARATNSVYVEAFCGLVKAPGEDTFVLDNAEVSCPACLDVLIPHIELAHANAIDRGSHEQQRLWSLLQTMRARRAAAVFIDGELDRMMRDIESADPDATLSMASAKWLVAELRRAREGSKS